MTLATDLRHGARALLKQPGLTAIAVLALTLGIGLTTTMFSIIEGAFLRGLPFPDADRIAAVSMLDTTQPDNDNGRDVFQQDFAEWRDAQQSFEVLAAFYNGTINVSGNEGKPERYDGAFVTANAFDVPRATPLLGRTFVAGDDAPGAPRVALLSYEVWQTRFKGDPSIVGRTLRVNAQPTTVVGVMPEGFKFPVAEQIWVPLQLDVLRTTRGEGVGVTPFGRLKPGVSFETAQAEFTGLSAREAKAYPDTNKNLTASVTPYINRFFGKQVFSMLYTMLGAVFGVMLIACANVANLLIARTAVRTKEIAIRTALGASRRRLIARLLTESFLLATAGTLFGLALAQAGIALFNRSIVDTQPPFWIDIRLDPTVLLFTAGLTLVATIASGLLPALQASRQDVNEVLKDESRGSSGLRVGRLSRALVVAEIAVSCGLLVASGLSIKTIVNLKHVHYGFATDNVFTSRVGLFQAAYPDDAALARFYKDLQHRLAAIPGAQAAAITDAVPTTNSGRPQFAVEGRTYATNEDYPAAMRAAISPGFFDTFDVRLVRGRDFSDADDDAAPRVAIVNESFAAKLFPKEDPIGRHFRVGLADSKAPWITIVGVAPDLYMAGIQNERPWGFYVPLAQNPPRFASLAVRAASAPMALTTAVRDQVAALDPDLPLYWVRTLAQGIAENNWHYSVFGSLFMAFGAAALFLATVGLYGVMAFAVSRRTQEIGLRMALGASGGRVLSMVLRQGAWQIGIGLALGIVLAGGLSRMLTILLYGVQPWDPQVFAIVIVALAAAATLACLIPARRAMRVDPMVALRYE